MPTVLVVDDDESIRLLVQHQLAAAGYEVVVAEDAIAAGHIVLRSAPDLIVLDVAMPYMNGFEFAAALNADTTLPFIPIVFLTSHEDRDDRARALGAVGYINKPLESERLVSLVRQHVPQQA